jgi:hypothetical protein
VNPGHLMSLSARQQAYMDHSVVSAGTLKAPEVRRRLQAERRFRAMHESHGRQSDGEGQCVPLAAVGPALDEIDARQERSPVAGSNEPVHLRPCPAQFTQLGCAHAAKLRGGQRLDGPDRCTGRRALEVHAPRSTRGVTVERLPGGSVDRSGALAP